jgi:Lysozyme like domain
MIGQVPIATILTPAQIAYYAQTAGFDGDDLNIAVAIALAESSGNPNVYNPETAAAGGTPAGQGSYGLWQIYLKDHPEYAGDNLYDPQTNANDAYELYSEAGGFSPWATYNSGAYQAYMGAAVAAPAPPSPVISVPGLPATAPTGTTEDASLVPAGMSTNTFLWIGAAIVAGIALWSFFE